MPSILVLDPAADEVLVLDPAADEVLVLGDGDVLLVGLFGDPVFSPWLFNVAFA